MSAEEFFEKNTNGFLDRNDCEKLMIEFAKYHVELALNGVNSKINIEDVINKDDYSSIINSYPLKNIK